jgi:hypothetical protein
MNDWLEETEEGSYVRILGMSGDLLVFKGTLSKVGFGGSSIKLVNIRVLSGAKRGIIHYFVSYKLMYYTVSIINKTTLKVGILEGAYISKFSGVRDFIEVSYSSYKPLYLKQFK